MTQNEVFESAASSPARWSDSLAAQQTLRATLEAAAAPLLICDYDGTLAPFREDKMQAYPYPGVAERLERIARGRSRLAFISGRPVGELILLLPLAARAEIWGMHGREHHTPEGGIERFEPSGAQREALDEVQAALAQQGYGPALERKAGSVALHWRNAAALPYGATREQAEQAAHTAFSKFDGKHQLALLPFDGGLELRTSDRTKAHAADALLNAADPRAAVFLGDDVTDEDAFRAMEALGGLGVLVRPELRPSHARLALHPPEELLEFLDFWLHATGSG